MLARGGTTGDYCMKKLDGELLYKGKPSPYNATKWKPLLDTDFKISDRCCGVMKKAPTHEYSVKNGVRSEEHTSELQSPR